MKNLNLLKIFLISFICLGISFCFAQEFAQRTPNEKCTTWVSKCLADFESIKTGMTRGEIEKKFSMDGGISTVSLIRFVHPECIYFKIDVEFELKSKDPNHMSSPEDKVIKKSKPYIENPVFD